MYQTRSLGVGPSQPPSHYIQSTGGGSGHGRRRKHGSSKRTWSPKSVPDPEENRPIQVTPSFLFLVNDQDLNEDTQAGGIAPRCDPNGYWCPPVYAAGFGRQHIGTLYRWADGVVTRDRDGAYTGGLTLYRAVTMFYCNPFYRMCQGDIPFQIPKVPIAQLP